MAVKKSEIYSSLWASCDALRGGMDASQYKDYVLVLLFVKYVSDKYAGDPNGLIEVPKGGSFADMVALRGNPEIGEKINIIISKLAEANDLRGIIDVADFNDAEKLGSAPAVTCREQAIFLTGFQAPGAPSWDLRPTDQFYRIARQPETPFAGCDLDSVAHGIELSDHRRWGNALEAFVSIGRDSALVSLASVRWLMGQRNIELIRDASDTAPRLPGVTSAQ